MKAAVVICWVLLTGACVTVPQGPATGGAVPLVAEARPPSAEEIKVKEDSIRALLAPGGDRATIEAALANMGAKIGSTQSKEQTHVYFSLFRSPDYSMWTTVLVRYDER